MIIRVYISIEWSISILFVSDAMMHAMILAIHLIRFRFY